MKTSREGRIGAIVLLMILVVAGLDVLDALAFDDRHKIAATVVLSLVWCAFVMILIRQSAREYHVESFRTGRGIIVIVASIVLGLVAFFASIIVEITVLANLGFKL